MKSNHSYPTFKNRKLIARRQTTAAKRIEKKKERERKKKKRETTGREEISILLNYFRIVTFIVKTDGDRHGISVRVQKRKNNGAFTIGACNFDRIEKRARSLVRGLHAKTCKRVSRLLISGFPCYEKRRVQHCAAAAAAAAPPRYHRRQETRARVRVWHVSRM